MSRNQRVALVLLAVVVAVAGFVLVSGGDDDSEAPKQATTTATDEKQPTATAEAPPTVDIERITIKGGKPVGGVPTIEVQKGEVVRLWVSSPDTSDEVHVHGYDVSKDLAPGDPALFKFDADIEGEFEVELEGAGVKIASLLVEPR